MATFAGGSPLSLTPLALAGAGSISRKLLCTPFAGERPFLRGATAAVFDNIDSLPPEDRGLPVTGRLDGGLPLLGVRPGQAAGRLAPAWLGGTLCSTLGRNPPARGGLGVHDGLGVPAGSLTLCGLLVGGVLRTLPACCLTPPCLVLACSGRLSPGCLAFSPAWFTALGCPGNGAPGLRLAAGLSLTMMDGLGGGLVRVASLRLVLARPTSLLLLLLCVVFVRLATFEVAMTWSTLGGPTLARTAGESPEGAAFLLITTLSAGRLTVFWEAAAVMTMLFPSSGGTGTMSSSLDPGPTRNGGSSGNR